MGCAASTSTRTSTSLSSDTIGASTGTPRSRPCSGSPRTITRRATGISLAATILAKVCRQSDASRDAEGQRQACSRMVQASLKIPAPAPLRVRLSSNAKCGTNLGQRDKPLVRFAESRKLSILDAVKAIRDDAAAIGFREYVWENRKCLDPVFAQDHLNYKALRERLADIGKRIARSNSATGVFRDSHPIRIKTSNIPYLGYVLGIIGVRTITIPLSSSRRPPLYEVFIARWFK